MRVMLDTNVLFSAFLFPASVCDRLVRDCAKIHTILLPTAVVAELLAVVRRKEPARLPDMDEFLVSFPYEIIYTPAKIDVSFPIRDKNDYKILQSAIVAEADVLVTGDKDFDGIELETLEICTPRSFVERFL